MLPEEYKILAFMMEHDRKCKTRDIAACDGFDEAIWNNMIHKSPPWVGYLPGGYDSIEGHIVPLYSGLTDSGVCAFREEQERLELFRQSAEQKAQEESKKEEQRLEEIRRSWWQFGLKLLFDVLIFLGGWVLGGITFPDALARVKSLFQ